MKHTQLFIKSDTISHSSEMGNKYHSGHVLVKKKKTFNASQYAETKTKGKQKHKFGHPRESSKFQSGHMSIMSCGIYLTNWLMSLTRWSVLIQFTKFKYTEKL